MEITRYDGTRFITEEEIDREFTGMYVLIRLDMEDTWSGGYLIASAEGNGAMRSLLSDIAIDELNSEAKIKYGCVSRGGGFNVQLLG
jgi:hypothetical protein